MRPRTEEAVADVKGLAALAQQSSDAVIIKTPDGNIVEWNEAAERLYGYGREHVIGKPISVIAEAGEWGEMLALIKSVASGGPVQNFRTTRRARGGDDIA